MMNGYGILDLILRNILLAVNPSREDWSVRFHIINGLREVVESIESLRGATVEPFGSFVSNLFTRWGDLDISIELPNGSHISTAGKKYKITLLRELIAALRKKGGYYKLQLVPHAKVPILKLQCNHNISCDISINNLSGQIKCLILFWVNEIDGRFRDLVLLVKEWAKAHNINDPKAGSLNSYSLSLLVVFHLQTCTPAIFPPLKDIYPGNMVDDLRGVRAVAENHIKETCEVHINNFRSKSRRINHSSLAELFISFLKKFSDIHIRAGSQGISPYSGQWEEIDGNMRWLPRTYALFIEDPFEQPANTARTVSCKKLIHIAEACQTSYQLLTSANQNQASLISTLVRPQISGFVAAGMAPIGNQNYQSRHDVRTGTQEGQRLMQAHRHQQFHDVKNGTNFRPRPSVPQIIQSPRQQQQQRPQPQNMSNGGYFRAHPQVDQLIHSTRQLQINDGRHGGNSHTPAQSSNGQGQLAWRSRSDR